MRLDAKELTCIKVCKPPPLLLPGWEKAIHMGLPPLLLGLPIEDANAQTIWRHTVVLGVAGERWWFAFPKRCLDDDLELMQSIEETTTGEGRHVICVELQNGCRLSRFPGGKKSSDERGVLVCGKVLCKIETQCLEPGA